MGLEPPVVDKHEFGVFHAPHTFTWIHVLTTTHIRITHLDILITVVYTHTLLISHMTLTPPSLTATHVYPPCACAQPALIGPAPAMCLPHARRPGAAVCVEGLM